MNELRQDIVSGDWVIIAPGRATRPNQLRKKAAPRKPLPKSGCPFEDLEKDVHWPPRMVVSDERGKWKVVAIANKYPALTYAGRPAIDEHQGIYHAKTGVGEHELVITRDHKKNFAMLEPEVAATVLEVLQKRHRVMKEEGSHAYVSTFFNWGASAGASIYHPHYQVLALPVIPPHVAHSLRGSETYFKRNKECVRCVIIKNERKEKSRIVAENEHAIAFAPYASKHPFEVSILPKKHAASFIETSPSQMKDVALLLQEVLMRIKKNVQDPDLNFFIHDAPLDAHKYPHHHWHIEVLPNISKFGGFEFATLIAINVISPEDAALILRK